MRKLLSAAAIAATVPFVSTAHAGVINWSDLQPGVGSQTLEIDGITVHLQSEPHGVVIDPDGGAGALGGGEDNEIGSADFWEFTFSEAVYIDKLRINRLHTANGANDIIDEGIRIISDNGTYFFTAVDVPEDTVLDRPDLGGTVRNLSAADDTGTGMWRFKSGEESDGLFGGPVTVLRFYGNPQDVFPLTGGGFLFENMKFTRVPAPGSAALIGLGGLAVARRRRR